MMQTRRVAAFVAVLIGMASRVPASAQDGSQDGSVAAGPTIQAIRVADSELLVVDGVLDEAVWRRAEPATDFRQRDPDSGAEATERTEVRIAFDKDRLVLGVICFDSEPARLLGNQMQRDQSFSADDRFMWSLDPYLDGRTGYFFEINPAGAMGDGIISGPGGDDDFGGDLSKSWDGIWLARVRRTPQGWTAEVEIPFKTLNFNAANDTWGANFQRTVRRKNEESLWVGWLRNEGLARMSNAGRIVGLSDISQGVGLDVKPYVLGSLQASPGFGSPATVGDADVGLDVFYNITPALRATFTVNTDFAETEVDDRQVNLTRYPLFFPEKREFFLSGANFYEFPPTPDTPPFFSRRIGLNEGQPQDILFGTKLLGQVGAFDVGALHVRTGDDEERLLPGEDFSVVRVRRRFGSQSYIGALYTRRAVLDQASAVDDRHTIAADLTLSTPNFRGEYNLEGVAWVAHTSPLEGAAGGSSAYGFRMAFPNDPWSADMAYREVQPAYDAAVGFTPRRGFRRWNPELSYNPTLSGHPFIRSFYFQTQLELITDLDNELITRESSLRLFDVNFHSDDSFSYELQPVTEQLEEDFEIADGILLPVGSRYSWVEHRIEAELADQRPLSGGIEYTTGGFFSGTRREVGVQVNVRPRPGINVGFEAEYNDIDLAEGSFVTRVYRLDARTQFNPWISLANDIQLDSESRVLGWQMRFRWILKPGDDIFFVYSHNWLDDLDDARYRNLDRRAAMKIVRTWRF
jgi:Domain of unknown function (DUF5916)